MVFLNDFFTDLCLVIFLVKCKFYVKHCIASYTGKRYIFNRKVHLNFLQCFSNFDFLCSVFITNYLPNKAEEFFLISFLP